jgi:uncharacterized membrane protein
MSGSAYGPENPCGTTGYPPPQYPDCSAPLTTPKNGPGTASFVVAVTALLTDGVALGLGTGWPIFGGAILGIVAVAAGSVALKRVRRGEADKRSFAIAGVVLGSLAIAGGVVLAFLTFLVLMLMRWVETVV